MRLNKLLLALAFSLGAGLASAQAPQYSIVDLGLLGTDTTATALGMSPGGVITGRSGSTNYKAFSWTQQGGMTALPGLTGRNYTFAASANDVGTVVGYAGTTAVAGQLPVRWQNGVATQLAVPVELGVGRAYDVNNANVAVGSVGNSGSAERAAFFSGSNVTLMPLLASGGQMVKAYAINDSGLTVGYGSDPSSNQLRVGLVYDTVNGGYTSLGTLAGKNGSIGYDINASGMVAGAAMQNGGGAVPMYWTQDGGMQAIPLLSGFTIGTAFSVNASGWAVGTMGVGNVTPFLFDGTSSYDLSTLVSASTGWTLGSGSISVVGISDSGMIAGTATFNGQQHAFALMPTAVPEPGSYALMLAGLASIGWVFRRRKAI